MREGGRSPADAEAVLQLLLAHLTEAWAMQLVNGRPQLVEQVLLHALADLESGNGFKK